ncbi:hypothetical protein TNCV_2785171 [Trichonephila clavipes]|nr:hypothetical protein TNCV_2785171 [Trichonephila clavipes]
MSRLKRTPDGMVVRRKCQLRCRPRPLTMVQITKSGAKSLPVAEQCETTFTSIALEFCTLDVCERRLSCPLVTRPRFTVIRSVANSPRVVLKFCQLVGVVGLSLAFCTLSGSLEPKLVDFQNAENRQCPCRMIIQSVKDALNVYSSLVVLGKIKF